jgi:hypothetical protein
MTILPSPILTLAGAAAFTTWILSTENIPPSSSAPTSYHPIAQDDDPTKANKRDWDVTDGTLFSPSCHFFVSAATLSTTGSTEGTRTSAPLRRRTMADDGSMGLIESITSQTVQGMLDGSDEKPVKTASDVDTLNGAFISSYADSDSEGLVVADDNDADFVSHGSLNEATDVEIVDQSSTQVGRQLQTDSLCNFEVRTAGSTRTEWKVIFIRRDTIKSFRSASSALTVRYSAGFHFPIKSIVLTCLCSLLSLFLVFHRSSSFPITVRCE